MIQELNCLVGSTLENMISYKFRADYSNLMWIEKSFPPTGAIRIAHEGNKHAQKNYTESMLDNIKKRKWFKWIQGARQFPTF